MEQPNDILRNSLIGAISSIEGVGGVLSFVLNKLIPEQAAKQTAAFLENLSRELEQFEEEKLIQRFQTEEYLSLFMKILSNVICDYRNKKEKIFLNVLINSLEEDTCFDEAEYFLHLIDFFPRDSLGYLYRAYKLHEEGVENEDTEILNSSHCGMKIENYLSFSIQSEMSRFRLLYGKTLTPLGKRFCDFVFLPYEIEEELLDKKEEFECLIYRDL